MPTPLFTPPGYKSLTPETAAAYLEKIPALTKHLGGDSKSWKIREVGDGNLNLVFIVESAESSVVIKQALPYVRMVGESWPFPIERSYFEHAALKEQALHATQLVPQVHHFDHDQALIVMDYLHPHIILRKGLIQGIVYPKLSTDISTFLSQTLFKTSDLYLSAAVKKGKVKFFADNTILCKVTEDLVFTDPYKIAELNRWTKPQLDATAARFRVDGELKIAAQELKLKFTSSTEALIHGDFHTGSIMVTETDTKVIDPEFAFVGPMGFDVGAILANLFLSYFSQEGHETADSPRAEYREWLLTQIEEIWTLFRQKFITLWEKKPKGEGFAAELFTDPASIQALREKRKDFLDQIFVDSLGFAGMKINRRILGLAHVEDLESIKNPDLRARCEKKALKLGRYLAIHRTAIRTIQQATNEARLIFSEDVA